MGKLLYNLVKEYSYLFVLEDVWIKKKDLTTINI